MIEVLIVGAGPAGSAAAIHLARAGRRVLLVDRCRFPRLKPCGEFFNPECARLLRELGVLDRILAAGARVAPELVLGTPGRCPLRVPFAGLAPPGDFAFSLGREVLDTLLVGAAGAAGAEVWEEALVREPRWEDGRVAGAWIRRGGIDREIPARIVLAADGLRSRFARCLGLALPSRRRKLGLTARFTAAPGQADRVEMHSGGPGCCGLSLRGGEANLGMVADVRQAREIGGDPSGFFRRELRAFPGLEAAVAGEPLSVRTFGPLTWSTRRQAVPGCLLLGDAAGYYDPFTGEGVTFALQTAALAAEATRASLEANDLSRCRLAGYEDQRRALLGPRLQLQRVIQAVLERPWLRDRILQRLEAAPDATRTLIGVVADVMPPQRLLAPGFLSSLLAR